MLDEFSPDLLLTRKEAAAYKGLAGESSVRDAELRGALTGHVDAEGRALYKKSELDEWEVKGREPTEARKRAILNGAMRARCHEAKERARKFEAELLRDYAEREAALVAEDSLRAQVRQKNQETRAAFEFAHMDERTAGAALGFKRLEARWRLRDLVSRGLLRRVESPPERRVEESFDGVREVVSPWPLCAGGTFFPREDVLALVRESASVATDALQHAPREVQEAASTSEMPELIVDSLRAFLEKGSR